MDSVIVDIGDDVYDDRAIEEELEESKKDSAMDTLKIATKTLFDFLNIKKMNDGRQETVSLMV